MRPRHILRRVGSVIAGLLMATSLAACSSARSGQGTTDESCYLALPTAAKAVGGLGHLSGVRKFSLSGLHGVAPRLYGQLVNHVPKGQSVCLAAYTGNFSASAVTKPLGDRTGRLAVVVVTRPGNEVLGTLILTKVPVRFQHMF